MNNAKMRGFSLIELMIAMVAGLIVSYAVVAFVMASLKSNGEYVQSTRLTQSLRDTLDFTTRELRRAGYDENALGIIATGTTSPFAPMLIDNSGPDGSCVIYAYDRSDGTSGTIDIDRGEVRGLRRVTADVNGRTVGIVEYAQSSTDTVSAKPTCAGASPIYTAYPAVCNTTSKWCPLSDPTTLNITEFTLTDNWTWVGAADPLRVQVRDVSVSIKGRLAGDDGTSYLGGVSTSYQRGVTSSVKVRADCQNVVIAACNASP